MKPFLLVVFAMPLLWPAAASAQLNVLISGGFSGAYEQLLPEFERTSGIKVTTGSGASQGTGPQTIAAQLARGVPANVVILSREGLTELIAARRIVAGTDVDLARVPLGVAVRAGTPKPDVSTVEAFKQVVLKAKTVAIPARKNTSKVSPRASRAEGCSRTTTSYTAPTGPAVSTGFRAWTDAKRPAGFVLCPCRWSGLRHYAARRFVEAYRENPSATGAA